GSVTASGDDRLEKHATTLRELSRQVPALASFADTLDRARQVGPGQASRAWLDLIVLSRQVRVALGTDPLEGEVVPLPPSGPWTISRRRCNCACGASRRRKGFSRCWPGWAGPPLTSLSAYWPTRTATTPTGTWSGLPATCWRTHRGIPP